MKIMETMAIPGRRQNTYSPEFKREAIAACGRAGATVARVALLYGLNTNVMHRWWREAQDTEQTLPTFVPLTLEAPTPPAATPTAAAGGKIRVELEHSGHRGASPGGLARRAIAPPSCERCSHDSRRRDLVVHPTGQHAGWV